MSLPYFQTNDRSLSLLQTQWSTALNPLITNPISNGFFLKNVPLINGVTTVNHLLGRMMQGWILSDVNAAASIYRSQPMNDKTLVLTSNAACIVNLYVF